MKGGKEGRSVLGKAALYLKKIGWRSKSSSSRIMPGTFERSRSSRSRERMADENGSG